ncbi:hypothetical protein [Caballeronia calidae]|uniref:hypothetical protein n=1 Tax=Caballeronia calidae TaxID=1777139 RepID=UPI0018DF130D|nr:hypothetical protein [Caballeronia calidae]
MNVSIKKEARSINTFAGLEHRVEGFIAPASTRAWPMPIAMGASLQCAESLDGKGKEREARASAQRAVVGARPTLRRAVCVVIRQHERAIVVFCRFPDA